MATSLRTWLALTGAGLALVAVATLPVSRVRLQPRVRPPEVERFDSLDRQLRREVGVLQVTRWSDSLSELTLRTAVDGLAVGSFGLGASASASFDAWSRDLRAYVDGLRPRADELVVGYFYQPSEWALPDDVPGPPTGGTHTYVGTRNGTAYCMQVEPIPGTLDQRELTRKLDYRPIEGIGGCRLFAKYGLAGARIQRWLDDGAIRFGRDPSPGYTVGFGGRTRTAIPVERPRSYASNGLPQSIGPFFGLNRPTLVDMNPVVGRCLAGDSEACLSAVVSNARPTGVEDSNFEYVVAHSPVTHLARAAGRSLFGWSDLYFLSDLESAFGPDAFARFWRSDQEVPQAFEAAFGVDMGAWIRDWARSEVGPYQAGARLPLGSVLWSVLALTLLAGAASLVGMRRRVA